MPFSCPDALIAIVSDFILALAEVEIAVVFSSWEDGIKLSVRSEDPHVHAAMAGGLIRQEQVPELGPYPKDAIRDMILRTLKQIK